MNTFNCTRCGTVMQEPAPGTRAACPNCAQMFETPADPNALPPPGPRYRREDRDFPGERDFGRPLRPRHSGLGVASFIIGAVVIVLSLLVILLTVVMASNRAGLDTGRAVGLLAGVIFCGGLIASLVGLGLGVGGLFQEDRNRTFAVLGVILNGFVLLAGVALVLGFGVLTSRRY